MGRIAPYTQVRNGKKVRVGGYNRRLLAASGAIAKRALKHVTRKQWAAAAVCGTVAAAGVGAYVTGGAARVALTTAAGVVAVAAVVGGRAAYRSARRSYAIHRHLRAQGRLGQNGPVAPTRGQRLAHRARGFAAAVKPTRP